MWSRFVKRLTTKARPRYPSGNVHSETLRALSFEEMKRVLGRRSKARSRLPEEMRFAN